MITTLPDGWFQQYSSLQAELGLKLLPAVATSDKQRKENVAQLKALSQKANINFPSGAPDTENVYWQLVAYSNDPLATQKFFQTRKVDTSTTSLVQISNLANYPYQGSTPNAERLHSNGLFVPAFPGLKNSEIKHIADLLIESAARKLM